MIKMNVNGMIKAKLTAYGAQLYNSYYKDMPVAYRSAPARTGTEVRMELWHAMRIFGHMMYNGMPQVPFVDNIIEIEESNLVTVGEPA